MRARWAPPQGPRRTAVGLGGVLLLAGAACYPQVHPTSPAPQPRPRPSAAAAGAPCPGGVAAPDPHRPVIRLTFDLSADRRTVHGTETVRFTPDRPVTELVFRLWPNGRTAPPGTRLDVTRAATAGGGAVILQSLGARAGTPGTLLSIPLRRTAPAGRPVTTDLVFTLSLAGPAFERWGTSGRTAWWASGHPLLAWERGRGWAREPAVRFPAEASVSEAAQTDVTVTAPPGDDVLMTGLTDPPRPRPDGRRLWHAGSAAARDVSVAVGHFTLRTATVSGVRVAAGVAADTDVAGRSAAKAADDLLGETRRAVQALVATYGQFPYPTLSVAALPGLQSGGIEYPAAILVGPVGWHVVLPHETAHQYFYGLVGDDQARDPWLDEAFATYSEARVNVSDQQRYLSNLLRPGRVGASMQSWGTDAQGYYTAIYFKGAAALLTARTRAGGPAFDAALRCYLRANAWTVARPADLAAALSRLPAAIGVLRQAGALP